jgi:hypothetical protein
MKVFFSKEKVAMYVKEYTLLRVNYFSLNSENNMIEFIVATGKRRFIMTLIYSKRNGN